ncbi:type II secretion system F family protein [Candidatus Uhrbacteria bacterium]|nr:type II secretion system F family protein [Candidatus Uhrbacteria bacterium]
MKGVIPWYKKEMHLFPVSPIDVASLIKNLAVMLEAGMAAPEAFEVLAGQSRGTLKSVATKIAARLAGGENLSGALASSGRVFSPLIHSAVEVGETSGTLSKNLTRVAKQMERELTLKRDIQGALLYPAIVVTATIILGLMLATFVLPELASVFASLNTELPWSTRTLIWSANIFATHGLWLSPTILVSLFALVIALRHRVFSPFTHLVALHLPAFGVLVHDVARSRFCRGVGILLESGVPLQEALEIQGRATSNYYYRQALSFMAKHISAGEGFGEALGRYPKLYPLMISRMVAVGERSGNLHEIFYFLARFYDGRVQLRAKNLSSVIEPLLLLLIGLGVAFVALSIFTPIYSITGNLGI